MAVIPPFFLDCVVAIGLLADGKTTWVASGFLYARVLAQENEQVTFIAYLVTNRHVLENHDRVKLRFNPQGDEPAREYDLQLTGPEGAQLWTAHPDPEVDVAVIPVNYGMLQQQAMQVNCFFPEHHAGNLDHLRSTGATEGDSLFVLGFPMGLVGDFCNAVIVRQGCVARIRDTLDGAVKFFLADAVVFPGNSGGPVICRPEISAITGTQARSDARLIGIVSGYVPYRDVAISAQTHQPRVTFEENSGLSMVFPVDCIDLAIDAAKTVQPAIPDQPAVTTDSQASEGAPEPVESALTEATGTP
jgi:hypothetical protein